MFDYCLNIIIDFIKLLPIFIILRLSLGLIYSLLFANVGGKNE